MVVVTLAAAASGAMAQEVNIYSSRHYDTDEALYSNFEESTGIKVNRIEDSADVLIERIRNEGRNSPADILITVDAGRLYRAEAAGVLQPFESAEIDKAVPGYLIHGDHMWVGLTKRARLIFFDKNDVQDPPQSYEALADPKYEGMICTRSSSNIYMISLLASIIANDGEEAAEEWAAAVWNNRARDPQGGDTDQLRGIVSGECAIALSNHYYFVRGLEENVDGLTGETDGIGWVFPNQDGRGTHVNISGAGLAVNAPNRDNATRFLEYLVSPGAQEIFARGNYEFPVIEGVAVAAGAQQLGTFKQDELDLDELGRNQALAQQIYDRVGYR